ncbi:hypothetical protein [Novipirellula sp.]|uniref:hypothetical protein n=1 Tax=Novipirellula sp. TaxID=2795430 RepID=UPI003567385F
MTLMNQERFWTIIAESRSEFDPNCRDGNMDSQVARLRDALSELPAQDVDSLADVAFAPGIEVTRFEEYGYIPRDVLRRMNTSEDDAGIMEFKHPASPAGEEWEVEDLPIRFPKLFAAEARYGV